MVGFVHLSPMERMKIFSSLLRFIFNKSNSPCNVFDLNLFSVC